MTPASGDSRSLDDLVIHVRIMALALLSKCEIAGIPLTVTFTYRSAATQAVLYTQGRTTPDRIVTNARHGFSYHNYGLALENWGDTPDHRASTDVLWAKIGTIGKSIGFRWSGESPHIPDRPHFEWSSGLTLADLRRGLMLSARQSTIQRA